MTAARIRSGRLHRRPMTVALVNNMPDAAFTNTEDQFRDAVAAAGGPVQFELYTIKEIPRSEQVQPAIKARYRGIDELWTRPPDALILTGTEPTRNRMQDEPSWPHLVSLLEWASETVPSVLLSCLSAHAGILLFDGIERQSRPSKCSGVFPGLVRDPRDPLSGGLPERVWMPHSRLNEIPEDALLDAGYRIVVGSDRGTGSGSSEAHAGWAVAARVCGSSLFVLCQSHPEYGTLSLLREYRRDVRRWLCDGRSGAYPRLPEGYLEPEAVASVERFAQRTAAAGGDTRALWETFPFHEVAATVQNTWAAAAATLYANWLDEARRAVRPPLRVAA